MFLVPGEEGHPGSVYARLVQDCEEFAHLLDGEADVRWLFKVTPTFKAGREILGTVYLPSVQGPLRPLFDWFMEKEWGAIPDFLVILDHEYWQAASERQREILVYHETCHMAQKTDADGVPVFDRMTGKASWTLAGHDVEEFIAVVRRYGAHNHDIAAFLAAAKGG